MNSPKRSNNGPGFEGTMVYEWWPPHPWPVPKDLCVFSTPVEGGNLSVLATAKGILRVSIQEDDAETVSVETCPIQIDAVRLFKIGVGFKDQQISVFSDGKMIGSNEPGKTPIDKLIIGPKEFVPEKINDETAEHYRCLRIDRVRELQARPGRRLLTLQETMDDLETEYRQISDLLGLIQEGGGHHVVGLAGRIRAVIARGNTMGPLLQRMAGYTGSSLPVYTGQGATIPDEDQPLWDVLFNIFPTPTVGIDFQLDLDEWLQLVGCRFNEKEWSNNEIIRSIADTDGAAHYDPSIEPIIDFFNGLHVIEINRDKLQSFMEKAVVMTASTILALIDQVRKDFNAH